MDAIINKEILIRARREAGLSISKVSIKIKKSEKYIESLEQGSKYPTIWEARKLAKLYWQSFTTFYLSTPPEKFNFIKDFRCLPDKKNLISPELNYLINTFYWKQEFITNYFQYIWKEKIGLVWKYSINNDIKSIINWIYKDFELSPFNELEKMNQNELFSYWMKKIENRGIFILKFNNIEIEECRWFVLTNKIAPFILINTNDSKNAQLFSLIHELIHILINEQGISNDDICWNYESKDIKDIEVFCNKITAKLLVDEKIFKEKYNSIKNLETDDQIKKLANYFKVSKETISRIFLEKNFIEKNQYKKYREIFRNERLKYSQEKKIKMKKEKWWPNYYTKKISDYWHPLIQTVMSWYYEWTINWRDASFLLDLKINNFNKLTKKILSKNIS